MTQEYNGNVGTLKLEATMSCGGSVATWEPVALAETFFMTTKAMRISY